jgi:predicted DNA binding CopG/RHH family protein
MNDKIYFSKNANVNLFENSNVLFDGVKLATNFSLIKSDYEKSEFLRFYENMKNVFLNNFSAIQSNLLLSEYFKKEADIDGDLSDHDYARIKSPNKCKH